MDGITHLTCFGRFDFAIRGCNELELRKWCPYVKELCERSLPSSGAFKVSMPREAPVVLDDEKEKQVEEAAGKGLQERGSLRVASEYIPLSDGPTGQAAIP